MEVEEREIRVLVKDKVGVGVDRVKEIVSVILGTSELLSCIDWEEFA